MLTHIPYTQKYTPMTLIPIWIPAKLFEYAVGKIVFAFAQALKAYVHSNPIIRAMIKVFTTMMV